MINNIKYQRPLPIKAQEGRTLVLAGSDRIQKAKQENARRRAIAENYFDQTPSISNLVKGVYYWATSEPRLFGQNEDLGLNTGTAPVMGAPVSTAVGTLPQATRLVGQTLPGLAFLSSWLGGRSSSTTPNVQGVSRTMARPRLMDRAEEAARDSVGTVQTDSIGSATPPPANPENNNNNNRDKKESAFKRESKKVVRNIGNAYGKVLKGGAYGVGFLGVPGGIGYGIYQAVKPAPTAIDSLLEQQSRQMIELNKLQQVKDNQAQIDAIRQRLQNTGGQQTPRTSTQPSQTTTLTPAQLDSINNLFYSE